MTKTFTENDLVRYVYGETTEVENIAIESALLCDVKVQERYSHLVELKNQLDEINLSPSETSVKSILDKVKELNLQSVAK